MPGGNRSSQRVKKRKEDANAAVKPAKVPKVNDGDGKINTLDTIEVTKTSTRTSGEGKSGMILLLILLYYHSLLTWICSDINFSLSSLQRLRLTVVMVIQTPESLMVCMLYCIFIGYYLGRDLFWY
jgi:hypothetical protein